MGEAFNNGRATAVGKEHHNTTNCLFVAKEQKILGPSFFPRMQWKLYAPRYSNPKPNTLINLCYYTTKVEPWK